ncbi:hypothetical protein DPSP01_006938 [Paraphaeosphaeria sporulosa]
MPSDPSPSSSSIEPEELSSLSESTISTPDTSRYLKAWVCGHTLHPSMTGSCDLCPPCRTEQGLVRLSNMANNLKSKDVPDPYAEPFLSDRILGYALTWYYAERLIFQHHIKRLEILADRERRWEVEHPDVLKGLGYTDARTALVTAWTGMPLVDWQESDVGMLLYMRARTERTKRARFADDVVEQPVRYKDCFARSHWRYTARRSSATDGEQWLDTPFWKTRHGTPEGDCALDEMWEKTKDPDEDELLLSEDIEEHVKTMATYSTWRGADYERGPLEEKIQTKERGCSSR